MKNKFIMAIFFCFAMNVVYAEAIKCPNLASNAEWNEGETDGEYWNIVRKKNPYDTQQDWSLTIGGIKASNIKEAFLSGSEIAKILPLKLGPMQTEQQGEKSLSAVMPTGSIGQSL